MPAIFATRVVATSTGLPPALVTAVAAMSLMGLSRLVGGSRLGTFSTVGRPSLRAMGTGLGVGLLLLAPSAGLWLGRHPAASALAGPQAAWGWVPLVTFIALAEEVWLRGSLQPLLRLRLGPSSAVLAVALSFAAAHVPLYGSQVLPLDLGAGILIGVLRERSGSVAACGLAHVVADLGWWLL
jgi:membrane protease YdiL (CAAX protease family)